MAVFVEKPREFEAKQFINDEESLLEMAAWLRYGWGIGANITTPLIANKDDVVPSPCLEVRLWHGVVPNKAHWDAEIPIGMWLVYKQETDEWFVMNNDEFSEKFLFIRM